jgi:hypothetical protein
MDLETYSKKTLEHLEWVARESFRDSHLRKNLDYKHSIIDKNRTDELIDVIKLIGGGN